MKLYPYLRSRTTFCLTCCLLIPSQLAWSQVFQRGGTFTLVAQNAPDNFTSTFSISSSPITISADNGKLQITESIHAISLNSEWLVLDIETTNGGPLAGDPTQRWSYDLFYPFQQTAFVDEVAGYWSFNEQAYSPITPFGTGFLASTAPNPLDPSLGPVFDVMHNPPAGPYPPFSFRHGSVILSPYNILANGGVNPSQANGFHYLVHAFSAAVPELNGAAALLATLGLGGLLSRLRRKSHRPRPPRLYR
ncbi:hypothetical protein [Chthonomonas calidirosea]|uniref:hypothetical protein n=1 Tax=Chthonomonas calidirosea TaxID=454171 RepID=UPI0006EC8A1B|nr:hypothetical protein [Chthonomonas calidirosea]CEK13052.1 hypothetical protein CP488_00336 [Chthonomonas calidirosea]